MSMINRNSPEKPELRELKPEELVRMKRMANRDGGGEGLSRQAADERVNTRIDRGRMPESGVIYGKMPMQPSEYDMKCSQYDDKRHRAICKANLAAQDVGKARRKYEYEKDPEKKRMLKNELDKKQAIADDLKRQKDAALNEYQSFINTYYPKWP